MTAKDFFRTVANDKPDALQLLIEALNEAHAAYCLIGGLAVNAYAEPVVSLDLDIVVVSDAVVRLRQAAASKGFEIRDFEHSVNLTFAGSDLRIQLQIDPRYQAFLSNAAKREVLGYELNVASLEDVLRGKLWARADPGRRKSKRQKDLADILRLVESHPELKAKLPPELLVEVE